MNDSIEVFAVMRTIFGLCPCCGELFRLSDCRIFLKGRQRKDWMDRLDELDSKLDNLDQSIAENEAGLRLQAAAEGRKKAQRAIRKIDPIFAPLRLHADDAKVLFHPVDYIVFNGMNSSDQKAPKSIVLLDRERPDTKRRRLQASIEKTIERENYEWVTLRVLGDGSMKQE